MTKAAAGAQDYDDLEQISGTWDDEHAPWTWQGPGQMYQTGLEGGLSAKLSVDALQWSAAVAFQIATSA